MSNCIMVGCDLHKKTMVLRYSVGRGQVGSRTFANNAPGREAMVKWLRQMEGGKQAERILFAYEASGEGFGLYDELRESGLECYVLAPTKIARSPKQVRGKNDGRDALQLLELLRAHVLAGNELPSVWVPDRQTRDDRELVRMRQDLSDKRTVIKNQIQSLLKRNELRRPAQSGKGWTKGCRTWLEDLAVERISGLRPGARAVLASLLRQLKHLEEEIEAIDERVVELSETQRYSAQLMGMRTVKGVGILTAMVYLTELGDLTRFSNRRRLAAYLGLIPTSHESGEQGDRKGHITRQGPSRVRKVLCQASWAMIRTDPRFKEVFLALVGQNPKRRKLALVAIMRRMAVVVWHRALEGGPPSDKPGHSPGGPTAASSPPESTGKAAA